MPARLHRPSAPPSAGLFLSRQGPLISRQILEPDHPAYPGGPKHQGIQHPRYLERPQSLAIDQIPIRLWRGMILPVFPAGRLLQALPR